MILQIEVGLQGVNAADAVDLLRSFEDTLVARYHEPEV